MRPQRAQFELQVVDYLHSGGEERNEFIDCYNAEMTKLTEDANELLAPLQERIVNAARIFDEVDFAAENVRLASEKQIAQKYAKAVAAAEEERDRELAEARQQYEVTTRDHRRDYQAEIKEPEARIKEIFRNYAKEKQERVAEFKRKQFLLIQRLKRQGVTVTGHMRLGGGGH